MVAIYLAYVWYYVLGEIELMTGKKEIRKLHH